MLTSHRSPARAILAGAVVVVTLGLGAGAASAVDTTEPAPAPTLAGETTVSLVDDPRVGLSFTHPSDWELSEVRIDAAEGATVVDPCNETVRFSIGADDESDDWRGISVELVPVDCEADNSQIGNGFHGLYNTIGDVAEPGEIDVFESPAGVTFMFDQTYFECTNECNDYVERLAIIELNAPADDRYPTAVIRDNHNTLDDDEFAALLAGVVRIETALPGESS